MPKSKKVVKRPANRKEQCFEIFKANKTAKVADLAKKHKIPAATLYKWHAIYKKECAEHNKKMAKAIKEIVQLEDAQHQVPVDVTNGGETWKLALLAAAAIAVVIWAAVTGDRV